MARACLPGYANGAWLVELAPLADPKMLPDTAAVLFDLPYGPERPALKALADYLRAKTLLLVLDNCEHMLDACAALAEHLLCECPQLRILATSREALGLAGETSVPVRSLTLPAEASQAVDLAALAESEAVRLFVDRAGAVRAEFELTEANAPHVAQICRRLDGIPLAIELAAARVRALSVEQIAVRLDDRFRLLTGGSRTALPRHQTLRATMDWSYDLLAPRERTLLARFSVFAGGWTLEAAEAVGGDPDTVPPDEVLDGLTHLVDKSLVVVGDQGGETRYRMLETVRQYARDRLHESGEVDAVRGWHLDYYLQCALGAEAEFHSPRFSATLERHELELDNLRATLEWSLGSGHVREGLQLFSSLSWVYTMELRGHMNEARVWWNRLLAQPEAATRTLTRAAALLAAGNFAGNWDADRAYAKEAVSIAREQGEAGRALLARGLISLGEAIGAGADDPGECEAMLAQGLALAQSLGDAWRWQVARALGVQANNLMGRGDYPAAQRVLEEGLSICESIGDPYEGARLLELLAKVRYGQRDYAAAIQQCELLVQQYRAANDRVHLAEILGTMLCSLERVNGRSEVAKAYCLESLEIYRDLGTTALPVYSNLGFIALQEGDADTARRLFAENLAAARERSARPFIACSTMESAAVLAVQSKPRQAVTLMAFFLTSFELGNWRQICDPRDDVDCNYYLSLARAQLDEAEFQAAWAEGSAMTLEQALAYAEQETAAPRES